MFIDAGACMGEYDIWLAKLGKRCIAIEPVNFATMTKRRSLNASRGYQTLTAVLEKNMRGYILKSLRMSLVPVISKEGLRRSQMLL